MESLAKEKIVKQALGDPEKLLISPNKLPKPKLTRTEERDEMFILPALKEETKQVKSEFDEEEEEEDMLCPKQAYDVNINRIDVNSTHFKSLPADIRHDILTDIKETRKQNTWGRLRELPVESNDFSSYQMSRLLRRRQVQIGLEEAEKEMGGKTFSLSELESLLSEDGVLEISDNAAQKIASDESTRFLLVRDIAKAMNEAKAEPQPSTSKVEISEPALEDDDDLELQRAIQLSLLDDGAEPEEDFSGRAKMNPEQRQKFSGTIQAHGLIRGFMMEYAEMNTDDIQDLMEATQLDTGKSSQVSQDSFSEKFPNTDDYVLYGTPKKSQATKESKFAVISDSESDSELVEATKNDSLVITVVPDLKDFKPEDDLFADVFDEKSEVPDVEVASISSDDDTLPYEIPEKDFEDVSKETESGFVSKDGKVLDLEAGEVKNKSEEVEDEKIVEVQKEETESFEVTEAISENEKFWSIQEPEFEAAQEVSENDKFWSILEKPAKEVKSPAKELSENEKFWADEASVVEEIEVLDVTKLNTPVKKDREDSPPPAKVPSPFFVNRKTPNSKKKLQEVVKVNSISVSKSLFEEKPTVLEKAANELRETKSSKELVEMKDDLIDQQKNLAQERNKLDRMGTNITASMSRDCKDLLKLFGIPYVDSPMEAEAQCAFLNMINLTDGTISDDSDIWLFGGETVYKNFFVQKKIVMEFRYKNIDEMFHLDRKKLIQLAMLVGSDYTVGINGIGAVTALEILAAFPPTPETDGTTDQYQALVSSLRKFREWFQNGKHPGPGGKTVLKSKLKNVELFEGFPNINVAKAYLEPVVDNNAEKFSWGMPDNESLVEYAKAKLGWTRMKTEELLAPVMKRLNEKKQATIKDYFKSQASKKFFENGKMSKRVQKAVGKMGGEEDELEVEEKPKKVVKKRKAATKKEVKAAEGDEEEVAEKPKKVMKKRKASVKKAEADEDVVLVLSDDDKTSPPPDKKSLPEPKAGTSKQEDNEENLFKPQKPKVQRKRKVKEAAPEDEIQVLPPKRAPRIPETKQIIPQREKDKEESEKAKLKAIEVFKKSKKKLA